MSWKIKRIWPAALSFCLALALLALWGCTGKASSEGSDSQLLDDVEGDAGSAAATIDTGVFTTSYEYAPEDTDATWDASSATAVTFDGAAAQVSGTGARFLDGKLTIEDAGTYVLSGDLANGQVVIDADKGDLVRLVLDGVSLHNGGGAAIYASQSEKVVLILADGAQNTVSDGEGYEASDDDGSSAAIFIQDDLSITGSGALTVDGNCKHGIRTQDTLAITGGVIEVAAVGDALRGHDGVAIEGGEITLNAEGDGIQSNNDQDDAKGFVAISGGDLFIQAKSDGVQAATALTVTGGTFDIMTGAGSANAPVREDDFRGGRQGQTPPAADGSVSMKALKAGKQLGIDGGSFTIDAEDDAVHSNDKVVIAAGELSIKTGDDGVHADGAVVISGGTVAVDDCYEGIEGLSVTVSGGDISVMAKDDALNAAGGVQNAGGRDGFLLEGGAFVRITGGSLDLTGTFDGIDANGDIYLEGGTVKVSGRSQGMDGAVDLDGNMFLTGGELITAGSVQNSFTDPAQPVLLVSYTQQKGSGSVIAIKDAKGNTLLEYISKTACSMSGFTSPSFTVGETYSLFVDGEKLADIRLSGMVTTTADDGSAYNGGRGGGRGGFGGGGPAPGGRGQSATVAA